MELVAQGEIVFCEETLTLLRSLFRSALVLASAAGTGTPTTWSASSSRSTGSAPAAEIQSSSESNPRNSNSGVHWLSGSINILADQSAIEDILREFGDQTNLRIVLSPAIHGKVSGKFMGLGPKQFLQQICRAYGLDWLYYNKQIYFYSNTESKTAVCTLRYLPVVHAIRTVEQIEMLSLGASIHPIPNTPMVVLNGPPKYIEIAQAVLRTLEAQNAHRQTNELVIQVFPLNYAWAYDVELSNGVRVEGVATTLSKLILGGSHYGHTTTGEKFPVSLGTLGHVANPVLGVNDEWPRQRRVAAPRALFSLGGGQEGAKNAPIIPSAKSPAPNDVYNPASSPDSSPSIAASVRANAIVIRDVRENMPFYKAAIAKLDVPIRVIEISAAIVDVDIHASRALGLSGINASIGGVTGAASSTTGEPIRHSGNLNIKGVFGTSVVTAALNFLERNKKAKILSRPTIVTLDNFGASIGSADTFYQSVQGNYVSNMFNVSADLRLEVVPHIMMHKKQPQIYMQVKVEDGSFDSKQKAASLPMVHRSQLVTQSIVRKDQSLLIGGLYRKVDVRERSGYPWLNQVPILSFFFSSNTRRNLVVERLFLITPRIVDINSRSLRDYSQYFHPHPATESTRRLSTRAPRKCNTVYVR
ncbi:Type III secretion system outer membrane protein SpiA precursor [Candidatus Xiphinematobacter sp. Idaho Grape]|nr:Type III secretion system outer membrane protein SpiA precursor [Candidatus Xiphinematobacter sp. Idaho Grape]